MVRGIEVFRKWFAGYEEHYAIIGGTACDLLMSEEGLGFRATKDIDLVLTIEASGAEFGKRFWEFVLAAGYEHRKKSTGDPQFYRFSNPKSKEYPTMIELFSRKPEAVLLPKDAVLSPIPFDEDVSSLSAILLDEDYYVLLQEGRTQVTGITVLDASFLILFKAKAWLDLSQRREAGERIDSRSIRKHKNDVFRLSELLAPDREMPIDVPGTVFADLELFTEKMRAEEVDLKQLGIPGKTKDGILDDILSLYRARS